MDRVQSSELREFMSNYLYFLCEVRSNDACWEGFWLGLIMRRVHWFGVIMRVVQQEFPRASKMVNFTASSEESGAHTYVLASIFMAAGFFLPALTILDDFEFFFPIISVGTLCLSCSRHSHRHSAEIMYVCLVYGRHSVGYVLNRIEPSWLL